jgi:hypothetical protein
MESDLIQALSAEKPAVEAINRWIREQQQIAYEEAQLEAAADHVLAVIGQKKKALDERRSALETFAPTVLAHFQEREKAEGSGRTFADVEGRGLKLRLFVGDLLLLADPSVDGFDRRLFGAERLNEVAFHHVFSICFFSQRSALTVELPVPSSFF